MVLIKLIPITIVFIGFKNQLIIFDPSPISAPAGEVVEGVAAGNVVDLKASMASLCANEGQLGAGVFRNFQWDKNGISWDLMEFNGIIMEFNGI